MKIDNLKENSNEVINEEIPELTEEQKELQEKFLRSGIIHKWHYHLRMIHDYMIKHKIKLEEVKEEIQNKKCKLNTTQRDLIMMFTLEFLNQLLQDMYKGGTYLKENETNIEIEN